MANYSLERFRSEVLDGAGLARNNRFEVIITPPRGLSNRGSESELASLYVEQASVPLLNIFAKPFKIFGPTYQRPITSEYGGEGMPITFHVDRNMRIRRFFEDWMHLIVDPDRFTVGYQENYISDIFIRQLDEQNNITNEIKLIEAFPRNINLMDLNNNSSNQTHRLNVLFAYRYWINTARTTTNPTSIPRVVVNPQVPVTDNRLKNVTYTGDYDPGTTNEDMSFGVGQLSA
jgi:hypothetical protein